MNLNPELKFWLLFLLINLLLFLPGYLFDVKNSTLLPVKKFLQAKSVKKKINYFFVRENQDPYKLNGDLITVCAILWLAQSFLPIWALHLLMGLCLALSFLYLIYYFSMVTIYQTVPVLYNDLSFAKVGLSIATQRFPLLFGLGIVTLMLVLWGFFALGALLSELLLQLPFPGISIGLLFILGIYNVYRGMRQKYIIIHQKLLVSPIIHLLRNLKVSWESREKMKAWVPEFFENLNVYKEVELSAKPNLVFVSVESYGALIHELPELRDFFHQKLTEMEEKLAAKSWYTSTNSSKAPRISGGSWLSHTSFLYGMYIDQFSLYESLMNNPVFENYQSLLHVLKEKGYQNYYLNPLGGYDMSRINWKQIKRMFAADLIINDEYINYQGQRTGSMGDSAPDQYAFNFAMKELEEKSTDPYALFFITNNSHYSWLSPTRLAEDWEALNDPQNTYEETAKGSTNLVEKYKVAIAYQLDIFFEYLLKNDPENCVFVLFGDHQPPVITTSNSTFHAPIHILGKDKAFVEGFQKYGFAQGLIHEDLSQDMAHQSFFSMFMKELVEKYGKEGGNVPEYFPEGHHILG